LDAEAALGIFLGIHVNSNDFGKTMMIMEKQQGLW
jgi:hypothetical protein